MGKKYKDTVALEHIKLISLLCVDSNGDIRLLYKNILENIVDKLIFAVDGEDGYEKFVNNNIDIIITDCSMPKLNGLDMIKKIRKDNGTIPIILVTAMDDKNMMRKVLQLHVNNFIQKPVDSNLLIEAIKDSVKPLISHRHIKIKEQRKLDKLQKKDVYNSYQEDLGFAKELNILRNDYYYQMIDFNGISLLDFLYKPLDIMSGDAYSARKIDNDSTFYLMIDGMGKGLSASLTAMIMTSFINHVFDKMISADSFDLSILIHETMKYIQPILLEEEALSIDYIVIDNKENMLYYSKFAMPVLLMEDKNNKIIRLKSNNPPLCKFQQTFNIDSYDIKNITKFLIYSDGIVENETKFKDKPYSYFIEEDFLNSFTREDFKNSFLSKIDAQEDDLTLIYIHKLCQKSIELSRKEFGTSLDYVNEANEWYEEIWHNLTNDIKQSYPANLVFTELFMNAYEHGNLAINAATKHQLLDEDRYYDTLLETQKDCSKKINVIVNKVEHSSATYIMTMIMDEGEGFDTQILSEIFRNSETFNGRGVFVSRKNSFGIYYNSKGNSVLFLNKVSKS